MLAFSADPSVTQQADKACLSSCRGCDGGKERNIKVMHVQRAPYRSLTVTDVRPQQLH